jgi:hypothetical protein
MSVQTIRQSLKGVALGLAQRNLTKAERLTLIAHQALLIDELRSIENFRRKAKPKAEPTTGQTEPVKPIRPDETQGQTDQKFANR